MEVRGTVVLSIIEFVRKNFAARYDDWLAALPPDSREIIDGVILNTNWYPLIAGCNSPNKVLCDLFYGGNVKGAWYAGGFSAEYSLKGICKLFLKFGSPSYIINKTSVILPTYYRHCKMKMIKVDSKKSILQIYDFLESSRYIEHRMGGWIKRALELSGCNGLIVTMEKSISKGDLVTEYIAEWK